MLMVSDAEAQTGGMERREERRGGRQERLRNDVQVRSNKETFGVQPVGRIYEDTSASTSAELRWMLRPPGVLAT